MLDPSPDVDARPAVRTFVLVAALVAVVAGIALRLGSSSDLWLDEALSVHIAALPLGDMFDALRRDGHPPLYYVLLHGWTSMFGEGDVAVRSLSGVLSVATLPIFCLAARRYGGTCAAIAGLVLLATNPFAIRYATEARMYALVMLLVVVGWVALRATLERRSGAAWWTVALTTGLLLLTHYWSFYLVAVVAVVVGWSWRSDRVGARRVLLAMAMGCALFLPWLPAFLDQAGTTGTPWGTPQRPTKVLTISMTDWGGGTLDGLSGEAQLLGVGLGLLVLLAVFARPTDSHRVELDLRTRPHVRAEIVVVAGTMGLAVLIGYATSSAFASRYTATIFPIVLLVAAYGVTRLPGTVAQATAIGVLAALGMVGGVDNVIRQRTQGGEIAHYIATNGSPGDVVAFCPDQLGPSVTRHLPESFEQLTYPDGGSPRFVNWVDYEEKMAGGDPAAFAERVHEQARAATVWIVWSGGYRTLGTACETFADHVGRLRPGATAVITSGDEFEHAWLYQYGPVP